MLPAWAKPGTFAGRNTTEPGAGWDCELAALRGLLRSWCLIVLRSCQWKRFDWGRNSSCWFWESEMRHQVFGVQYLRDIQKGKGALKYVRLWKLLTSSRLPVRWEVGLHSQSLGYQFLYSAYAGG
jgi:hypothetical protein